MLSINGYPLKGSPRGVFLQRLLMRTSGRAAACCTAKPKTYPASDTTGEGATLSLRCENSGGSTSKRCLHKGEFQPESLTRSL